MLELSQRLHKYITSNCLKDLQRDGQEQKHDATPVAKAGIYWQQIIPSSDRGCACTATHTTPVRQSPASSWGILHTHKKTLMDVQLLHKGSTLLVPSLNHYLH